MDKKGFQKSLAAFFVLVGVSFFGAPVDAATYAITVSGSAKQGSVPHFWSECLGTGTMEFCLHPAWQTAARIAVKEAGIKRVRGHGILIHGTGVDSIHVLSWAGGTSTPTYNWKVIDAIYDTLTSIGLDPVVELSFMPPALQSNGVDSKPKNWNIWRDLIDSMVTHFEAKYGAARVRKWYWEVWNEPDYSGFWNGTMNDYDTLFSKAVEGAKSADSLVLVGGPGTTGVPPEPAFLTYCANTKTKIDFLDNHCYGILGTYGSDPAGERNDNRTRSNNIKNFGKKLLSINSEYNTSYSGQGGNSSAANCVSMDSHINAPFITKCVKLILDDYTSGQYSLPDVFSYWAISDCFDESTGGGSYIEHANKIPFAQVFGLINYQGLRKAAFNAYKMLHMMGNTRISLTGGSNDSDGVDGFATLSSDSSQVAVLLYSYYKSFTAAGADNIANVTINNIPLPNGTLTVRHYRVDSTHSNPYSVWIQQGKPVTPTTAQWGALDSAQNLAALGPDSQFTYTGAPYTKSISLPHHSVSLLLISRQTTGTITGTPQPGRSLLSISGTMVEIHNRIMEPVKVSVYSANGRLIWNFRTSQRSVDLGKGLKAGMYVVRAETRGMCAIKNMLVQ